MQVCLNSPQPATLQCLKPSECVLICWRLLHSSEEGREGGGARGNPRKGLQISRCCCRPVQSVPSSSRGSEGLRRSSGCINETHQLLSVCLKRNQRKEGRHGVSCDVYGTRQPPPRRISGNVSPTEGLKDEAHLRASTVQQGVKSSPWLSSEHAVLCEQRREEAHVSCGGSSEEI